MKNIGRNTLLGLLFLILLQYAWAQPKIPPTYHASSIEIARLPKYCWAQYVDGAYFGHPVYSIPASCGAYTNHFCSGLVVMMRASNMSKSKAQRREDLRMAADNVAYTLKYIKPPCSIYGDAQAAKNKIEYMQNMLN